MTHLVLVGLMGAGKTTVGQRCAEKLARPFVDTDDVASVFAGMPVPEFLAERGEPAFREIESQAVAEVCASPTPLVIATGGGVPLDPKNRERLRANGTVVWLQAPPDVLVTRVGKGESRPLLAGDPRAALTRLAATREAAYEAVAHEQVETSDLTVDEVAAAVIARFEEAES